MIATRAFKFTNKYSIPPLSDTEVRIVIKKYSLGQADNISELEGGVMNRAYRIVCGGVVYVLKKINPIILGNQRDEKYRFVNHLRKAGLNTHEYVVTSDGDILWGSPNAYFEMTKFIDGIKYSFDPAQDENALGALADFYRLSKKYCAEFDCRNSLRQILWESLIRLRTKYIEWSHWLNFQNNFPIHAIDGYLKGRLFRGLNDEYCCQWIHGDYNPSNIIFDRNGGVIGLIDFDRAQPNNFIIDLVIYLLHASLSPVDGIQIDKEETFLTARNLNLQKMENLRRLFLSHGPKFQKNDLAFFAAYGCYYILKRNMWRLIQSVQNRQYFDSNKTSTYCHNIAELYKNFKTYVNNNLT